MSEDELVSRGSKLESFGLTARVETGEPWGQPVFRPLDFGYRLQVYRVHLQRYRVSLHYRGGQVLADEGFAWPW